MNVDDRPTSVFLDPSEHEAARRIMQNSVMQKVTRLLHDDDIVPIGYHMLQHIAHVTWDPRRIPPAEWFGAQMRKALTLEIFENLMRIVIGYSSRHPPTTSEPCELQQMINTDAATTTAALYSCTEFFKVAEEQDLGRTHTDPDIIRLHQRRQGVITETPSFFENTLVVAKDDGHDGIMPSSKVMVSRLVDIQIREGCRSVVAPNVAWAISGVEALGHTEIFSACLRPVPDPMKGVNIATLPFPDARNPSNPAPLLFEYTTQTGAPPSAEGSMLCANVYLEFPFQITTRIHAGTNLSDEDLAKRAERESVLIRGFYSCEPHSRRFVTRDSILTDIFDWSWHQLRAGRRLDVVIAIEDIRAKLLGVLAEALTAKQTSQQIALGL
jgi:hypothetical protein